MPATKLEAYKLKAEVKARLVDVPIVSLAPKFGKDGMEYTVVVKDGKNMEWVYKGIEGLHGNQAGPVAFLTTFAHEIGKLGIRGKITIDGRALPPVAALLKKAAAMGLTYRPGRKPRMKTDEEIEAIVRRLVELYGDIAREGAHRGREAARRIRSEYLRTAEEQALQAIGRTF